MTYANHWETVDSLLIQFVELYECTPESIRLCCVIEIDALKGWLENKLFPLFVKDSIGGIVRQLEAIEDAPEPIQKVTTLIEQPVIDPRKVQVSPLRATQAGASSTCAFQSVLQQRRS